MTLGMKRYRQLKKERIKELTQTGSWSIFVSIYPDPLVMGTGCHEHRASLGIHRIVLKCVFEKTAKSRYIWLLGVTVAGLLPPWYYRNA